MVQSIAISINGEDGERLAWAETDFAPVFNELMARYHNDDKEAAKDFPFIATIDPYGTTFFNKYQVPLLTADLERFANEQNKDELQKVIGDTIEFMRKKIDTHKLIKFIGD